MPLVSTMHKITTANSNKRSKVNIKSNQKNNTVLLSLVAVRLVSTVPSK